MSTTIETKAPITAKPMILPQETKSSTSDSIKKEPAKKEPDNTNKLLLTLAGLAVIAGGIYYATKGKGGSATKATNTLSSDTKPASTLTGSGTQKKAADLTSNSAKGTEEITPYMPSSKEEQELTDLLTREKSKYSSILKKLEKPEEIPTLPENKADLNGIFKTTEQDKTIYHLYEKGELKGKISPEPECFHLKADENNSVFIWPDGEITHEIASKEGLPPEIKKYFENQYTEQEIGNIRITKSDNRIGISEIHPIDDKSEHRRGIGFSFVKSL